MRATAPLLVGVLALHLGGAVGCVEFPQSRPCIADAECGGWVCDRRSGRCVPPPADPDGALPAEPDGASPADQGGASAPDARTHADAGLCGAADRGDGGVDGTCCRTSVAAPPCNGCPAGTFVPAGWVCIPGGEFDMGSSDLRDHERPVHRVTIRPFLIQRTKVTNAQYLACVEAGACTAPHWDDHTCWVYAPVGVGGSQTALPPSFRGPNQPVVCVSWEQARAYAAWVGGRLPSEAEWEYAARGAGRDLTYPWGEARPSCRRAVIAEGMGRRNGCGSGHTLPVCSLSPNGDTPQGLCDMAGNAYERVEDCWHESYVGAPSDGSAWTDDCAAPGTWHVYRGSPWNGLPETVDSARRGREATERVHSNLGFRLARSLPADGQ